MGVGVIGRMRCVYFNAVNTRRGVFSLFRNVLDLDLDDALLVKVRRRTDERDFASACGFASKFGCE